MAQADDYCKDPPYSPKSLAKRWETTDKTVTNMCKFGGLPHFRLGLGKTLIRIRASTVYQWERDRERDGLPIVEEDIDLDSLMDEPSPSGTTKMESVKRDASTLTQKSRDALHSINSSANGKKKPAAHN